MHIRRWTTYYYILDYTARINLCTCFAHTLIFIQLSSLFPYFSGLLFSLSAGDAEFSGAVDAATDAT